MHKLKRGLTAFRDDRRAITALEYGIMAGWLSAIIILAFIHFGAAISTNFAHVGSSI